MVSRRTQSRRRITRGFTLIELMVVLAIIALLVAIVSPRYFRSVDRARETSLHTSLNVMRDAIDKFAGDLGRYPESLDELAQRKYVREIPVDPITGRRDTWIVAPPPADAVATDGVADVHSGASGAGLDGVSYQSY
jgi:prepilin-type N-terminal cleavage/methylation domain-containing protein